MPGINYWDLPDYCTDSERTQAREILGSRADEMPGPLSSLEMRPAWTYIVEAARWSVKMGLIDRVEDYTGPGEIAATDDPETLVYRSSSGSL